jgi:hypothetical protein
MTATGPTICLPHLLQKAWPGCTVVPHPSQNMIFLPPHSPSGLHYLTYISTDDTQMPCKSSVEVFVSSYRYELSATREQNEKAARQQGDLFFFKGE